MVSSTHREIFFCEYKAKFTLKQHLCNYIVWHTDSNSQVWKKNISSLNYLKYPSFSLEKSLHFLENILMKFATCGVSGSRYQDSYAYLNHLK